LLCVKRIKLMIETVITELESMIKEGE